MDINRYISENGVSGNHLNQIQFKIVLGLDKDNVHIPKWFKDKRVVALIDYCINEHIIPKERIFYKFSYEMDPFDLKFVSFHIKELTLEQLTQLSHILPAPDLKELIKFKPSEPYHTPKFTITKPDLSNYFEMKKMRATSFYDLDCKIDMVETKLNTILTN